MHRAGVNKYKDGRKEREVRVHNKVVQAARQPQPAQRQRSHIPGQRSASSAGQSLL